MAKKRCKFNYYSLLFGSFYFLTEWGKDTVISYFFVR